jgi:hypothetical protein
MQPAVNPSRRPGLAEQVARRVLVQRVLILAGEQPAVRVIARPVQPHVLTQDLDQLIRDIDRAFAPALRLPDLDATTTTEPLHLSTHVDLLTEEVDIRHPQRRSLTQPQACERAHSHQGSEIRP